MGRNPGTIKKENLTFGEAIEALKKGNRAQREGWNGKGMFIFQRPSDKLDYSFIDKVKLLPDSVKNFLRDKALSTEGSLNDLPKVEFTSYLCMYAADGSIVNGWLASQTDMLAEDWVILD